MRRTAKVSVCVCVHYSHMWPVVILSQSCWHCIRFMLLMWSSTHDVSLWEGAVTIVTQELAFEVMMSLRRSALSFPRFYRKQITLTARPFALPRTAAEVSRKILTDVTEQNQYRAFPHSTAVLQQVQILQGAQTHTHLILKWPKKQQGDSVSGFIGIICTLMSSYKRALPSIMGSVCYIILTVIKWFKHKKPQTLLKISPYMLSALKQLKGEEVGWGIVTHHDPQNNNNNDNSSVRWSRCWLLSHKLAKCKYAHLSGKPSWTWRGNNSHQCSPLCWLLINLWWYMTRGDSDTVQPWWGELSENYQIFHNIWHFWKVQNYSFHRLLIMILIKFVFCNSTR